MQIKANNIFSSISMDTVTTSSLPINVAYAEGYSVQATFDTVGAAGVTGSFQLQASLDFVPDRNAADTVITNWAVVSGSATAVQVSGSGNSVLWNVGSVYYPWLRLQYVGTAGSGSLSARVLTKNPR